MSNSILEERIVRGGSFLLVQRHHKFSKQERLSLTSSLLPSGNDSLNASEVRFASLRIPRVSVFTIMLSNNMSSYMIYLVQFSYGLDIEVILQSASIKIPSVGMNKNGKVLQKTQPEKVHWSS